MNLLSIVPVLGQTNDLWYALPLVAAVSFVYSATRHERWNYILSGAIRTAIWISGFMLVIFALLWIVSSLV